MSAVRCFRSSVFGILTDGRQKFLPFTSVLTQQQRFKGNRQQRFKAPPEPKEKRQMTVKRVVAEKKMTPKELEEFMARVPQDDVWLREHYPPPKYRLTDTLRMHRELACLEMQDNMKGLLYARLQLDMSKKKKTQFMSVIAGTVLYPHLYEDGIVNRVVALTKDAEEEAECINQGATYAGGLKVIKMIERGDIRAIDYDHIVCHSDLITSLAVIKKHLRNNYPSRKNRTLGDNVPELVNLFVNGRAFESVKQSEAVAHMTAAFGTLDMPDDHLCENFQTLIDTASALKSRALSKLVTGAEISCPPSTESFHVLSDDLLPSAAETESEDEDEEMEEPEVIEMDSAAV